VEIMNYGMKYKFCLYKQTLYLLLISFVCLTQNIYARSLPDFTPLVEANSAAVVNISTALKKSNVRKGTAGIQYT